MSKSERERERERERDADRLKEEGVRKREIEREKFDETHLLQLHVSDAFKPYNYTMRVPSISLLF